MIVFFRKIRQNLLMENKTGKYLKYAVGEILLVMIGILLALQVNNWNENRKEKLKTEAYLHLLLEDFKQESINIKGYTEESKGIISRYEAYEEKFSQSDMSLGEIATGLNAIKIHNTTPVYGINTIEILESTGDIRLISDEIRKELLELNRYQEYLNHITKRNRTIFATQNNELGQLGWTAVGKRLDQNPTTGRLWTKIKSDEYVFKILLAVESIYHGRYNQEKTKVDMLSKYLSDMAHIEELINAELDK
jgi:hypothetical protein